MSRLLFILLALVGIAAAIVFFAPEIIPVSTYKARVETAASGALGREVTIGDELSFKVFPRTAFHVSDLKIANAPGFEGDHVIEVDEADIGVSLIRLIFGGAIEVDQFILRKPIMNLQRNAAGEVNWNFAREDAAPTAEDETARRAPSDLRLGDVRIIEGVARYEDIAAARSFDAKDVNVSVVLNSMKEPLRVRGDLVFQGEPSRVDIVLTSLADLAAQKPANLKLDMKVGDASVGGDLIITNEDTLNYKGPIRIDAPDLPAFGALLGAMLEEAPGFDSLNVTGDVDGGASGLALSNANIAFDAINAQGAFNIDWSGERPLTSGILSTDNLDLRPYLPPPTQSPAGFPAWSEAKLNFKGLRNVDADFDVSADAIYFNNLRIGESRLKLKINNGRMTADIPELAMYGGQGSGRLVVNARQGRPSFSGAIDMDSVRAQPLSVDLVRRDNLLGLGSLKLDFTANGDSQAAIMRTLDGAGGFDLADGALKGVNVAKIVRSVGELRSGVNILALQNAVTAARGPTEQTDFSQFLTQFTIADGLMRTPNISLNGPFLTMTGTGSINLPNQTIDLKLSPRATTTVDGQDGQAYSIPMLVGGSFSNPKIQVDAERLLLGTGENSLLGIINEIGRSGKKEPQSGDGATQAEPQEQQDPARSIIEGIFGPANNDNQDGGAKPEEALANDLLNSIFAGPKEESAANKD